MGGMGRQGSRGVLDSRCVRIACVQWIILAKGDCVGVCGIDWTVRVHVNERAAMKE
jgi:hypothetical protein